MSSNPLIGILKPSEQVFGTTELLEHILSFLPMPSVLGKSRVSRQWKAVIDNSLALQKKLFLPHSNSQVEVLGFDHSFPQPDDSTPNLDYGQLAFLRILANLPVYTTPIELNPLTDWGNQGKLHVTHTIEVTHPQQCLPSIAGLEILSGSYSSSYIHHRFGQSFQKTQSNSSWRKMYLTAPPITDIMIHVPTTVDPPGSTVSRGEEFTINIHSEHGVTLGLLYDTVEGTLKKFRMVDERCRAQKRKEGPLKEKDYVKGWGNKERVMFLVQPKEDTAELELQ